MLLSDTALIENTEVEGTTLIEQLQPIRLQKQRLFLGLLLSLTVVFPLACSWSVRLIKAFFFEECSLEKSTHMWVRNNDGKFNISRLVRDQTGVYFISRRLKYISEGRTFRGLIYDLGPKSQMGLQPIDVSLHRQLYGPCAIEIPPPNVFLYLLKELTAPFYVLQYLSCVLWVAEGFALMAIIMITVSLLITTINFFLLRNSANKLRELAECQVQVKTNRGQFNSKELVPGDILEITAKMTIPCDCVLLEGELLMNEASLTGESVPVPKFAIDRVDSILKSEERRHWLFEGTKVLKTESCKAIVSRTGFASFKGQIFRSVLYPKPQEFTFYRQGIKYLCYLAIYVMLLYFIALPRLISMGYTFLPIFYRFWDALTWIIPPALPIFVSMCMTFSLVRLRKKGIFGVDPQKSLIAGKVDTICFDKTGTLTTIGIDVYGYQTQDELGITNRDKQNCSEILMQMFGTCHGCYLIDGELLGDSLDVAMFQWTGLELIHEQDCKFAVNIRGQHIKVMRMWEFESALQRMSVLVELNNQWFVFVKGSPEMICELSNTECSRTLENLTMQGLRVIALAWKQVDQSYLSRNRSEFESDLTFAGLLAMENKLKSDTAEVINKLGQTHDLKIISGDNALTTIQCARECGLLAQKPVLLLDYDAKSQQLTLDEVQLFSKSLDSSSQDICSQETVSSQTHVDVMNRLVTHLLHDGKVKKYHQIHEQEAHAYAITGKAFDYFWAQNPQQEYYGRKSSFAGFEEPLNNVEQMHIDQHNQLFAAIVSNAKVFARMRPEQKSQIIEQLQTLGRTTIMIGDGANDCAAIKQADVGISFASSDASYSAPYSTSSESIGCITYILLDGRASLQNAVEVFQYYVIASVIKYVSAMLVMIQGQNYDSLQYIWINYVGTIPLVCALTLSAPHNTLTKDKPKDDMMHFNNIKHMSLQVMIASIGLLANYIFIIFQSWDDNSILENGYYSLEGDLQTSLFTCTLIYCLSSCIATYVSLPFKKAFYTQKPLIALMILTLILTLCMIVFYQSWYYDVLSLHDIDLSFRAKQFLITIVFATLLLLAPLLKSRTRV